MFENCSNCKHTIKEKFCSNCGQKKYKRIDRKYIWDELQFSLLHTNKGFLYSVKNIIKNPGKTAKGFIDGNRVNHYKPILLVFVLSGISAFISFKILNFNEIMLGSDLANAKNYDMMKRNMAIVNNYNALIMLATIPIMALFTKLSFYKWGNNYYEHVIMNAFGLAFYTLFNILIVYPILYFSKNNVPLFIKISSFSNLLGFVFMVYFFKSYYVEKPLISIILRVLLIILLFTLIFILSVILMIVYMKINGLKP